MTLPLRLAVKGLRVHRSFSIAMILNIALGVLGYLVVGGFNDSFLAEIRSRTQATAAGDLIASSRVEPPKEAVQALHDHLPPGTEESFEQSLLTMAAGPANARLVEVRFIDANFPLYGKLKLNVAGEQEPRAGAKLSGTQDAWIYPELRSQLGVKLGDSLKIGNVSYLIKDLVDDDPTSSGMGFVLAPRVYVSRETAQQTALLVTGSRVQWMWRFKLPPSTDVQKLEESLRKVLNRNELRVRSHHNATEEIGRLQAYLNDYLGLVALAALFLSTVGTSYMLRGHLTQAIKEFGIMMSLGATSNLPVKVFALQAVMLGAAGSLVALAASRLALPALAAVMAPITGKIQIAPLSAESLALGIVMAIGGGLLMALPLMRRLTRLKPAFLFQESSVPTLEVTWQTALWYLPALALWWGASVLQSHSWRNGSIFAGAFLGSALILALWGFAKLKLLAKVLPKLRLGWQWRLALTQIARGPLAALSTFLALALGTTLLNVIPQIRASVAREIERPDSVIPQFFMFDIQDDQIDGLKDFHTRQSLKLSEPSAMVRARLDAINAESAENRKLNLEGDREQEQRENLQSRMQNLSFRSHLSSAETLVDGTFVGEVWDGKGLPSITLEQEFARRLGLAIGDVMKFDISGIPVEGRVSGLRKVRWTSFQPNFFILFQPGVLDDAPKVWVASTSGIDEEKREATQSELVANWPNVSVVDVKATVKRLLELVDQISAAIGFVALLALVAGLGVLFAIAGHQARERRLTFALLKTLGAKLSGVSGATLLEYGLLALGAVTLGTLLSLAVSYVLSVYIFKAVWQADWRVPGLTAAVLLPLSLGLTWLATRTSLAMNVNRLLR